MIALTEIHKSTYVDTYCINLKNLCFNTFYKYISEFSDLTDIELDRLTTVVWKKTFVFYCLYLVYKSQKTIPYIKDKVKTVLNKFIIEENLNIEEISEGGNCTNKFNSKPLSKILQCTNS
jgi:hypothetical protein